MLSWHSLCDDVVTYSPTTPITSAFTAYPEEFCEQDVKIACAEAKTLLSECLAYISETDTTRFSSCTCRPELQQQDYTCEYIGNVTCLGTTAALSSLFGYSVCSNFAEVIGSITVSVLTCRDKHTLMIRSRKETVFLLSLLPLLYPRFLSRRRSRVRRLRQYRVQRSLRRVQAEAEIIPG